LGFFADLGKKFSFCVFGNVMGHFKTTVCAGAHGVDDTFGKKVTIEIGKLLNNMKSRIRVGPNGPVVTEFRSLPAGAPELLVKGFLGQFYPFRWIIFRRGGNETQKKLYQLFPRENPRWLKNWENGD
jgi:hypothetical protein